MGRPASWSPPRAAALALSCLALAAAPAARANGAFPDDFSVHFAPDNPHRIYVGANFGLLVSEDDGLTWRYACEPWVVAGSNAALASASVSFYDVTAGGALMAASINLTRSSDVACTWPASGGAVAGQTVADFFPDPNDASFVLAIVLVIQAPTSSHIVASHDGGKTFDAPHLYETPDLLTGVEIARSKPGVVYATSVSTSGGPAKFLASTDSGVNWTETTLTIPAATEPRLLAVDPVDEKTVYIRIQGGTTDEIRVTVDAGQTFQTALPPITGKLSSFLRAGDGALYAGTRTGKLYVQPAGATGFTARDAPHLRCLGQRPGSTRIYACTDMIADGYSVATSDDGGASFQPVMSFTQLLGPLTCEPVQTNCAAHWGRIQGVLGITKPDAGQADAGTSGPPAKGSSCASAGGAGAWSVWVLALFHACKRRARRRLGAGT